MKCPKCEQCGLSGNMVPGEGSQDPSLILIGEAPGAAEVEAKRPFVGQAGKVARSILKHLNIPENAVYITNLVKCRPPENRDPSAAEIECCSGILTNELIELGPGARTEQVTVALGVVSARYIFPGLSLRKDRGKVRTTRYSSTGLATFHPAAALYPKGDTLFPYILNDLAKAWRIARGEPADKRLSDPETHVVVIDSDDLMQSLILRLKEMDHGKPIAFDWETTGLSPLWNVGYCLSLSWKPGTAVVIPMSYVRRYRTSLFEALHDLGLLGFNAALFDSKFNEKYGLPSQVWRDPMLMHYLLDERPQQRSLENLTVQFLDAPPYEGEMLAKYKCKKSEMYEKVPEEEILEYAGKDADWTLRLWEILEGELRKEQDLVHLYEGLIAPGARAFADIRQYGVWVDKENLTELSEDYLENVSLLEKRMQDITKSKEFNPRSHPQVHKHLWDTLGLEEPDIFGRKPRSADEATLEALVETYPKEPFVQTLKEYRKSYTLYSRYLKGMEAWVQHDGRVRTNYHFDRTETGRLSTTDPAIHTIPRESNIRGVFAAPPGFALVQADYAQIEIRMAAHIARDDQLTELLRSGTDFHTKMASEAFHVPVDKVTPEQRQAAKSVSFGLLYLMGDKKLAASTGLPPQDALDFVKRYKGLMPDVQKWIQKIKRQVRTDQYIVSPFGRRRRFPFITENNLFGLQREAVNFPIQSGASDLTLSSVIELHSLFTGDKFLDVVYPEARIVIMVHDSIIVECPTPIAQEVAEAMKSIMEKTPFDTRVPFPVEVKIGRRWGEGEAIG